MFFEGLEALGGDKHRVKARQPRAILGSLNIEVAQLRIRAQRHAWDYGIGLSTNCGEAIVWLEVHSANSLHVQIILDKLDSLITFLRDHGGYLHRFPSRYVWLATGGVAIAPASRERRRLNARGIILKSKQLRLESVM